VVWRRRQMMKLVLYYGASSGGYNNNIIMKCSCNHLMQFRLSELAMHATHVLISDCFGHCRNSHVRSSILELVLERKHRKFKMPPPLYCAERTTPQLNVRSSMLELVRGKRINDDAAVSFLSAQRDMFEARISDLTLNPPYLYGWREAGKTTFLRE
jgi:hypothetical protein